MHVYSASHIDAEDLRSRLVDFRGHTSEMDAVVRLIEDSLTTGRAAVAGTVEAATSLSRLVARVKGDSTLRSAQVAGIGYHFRSMGLKDLDAASECLVQAALLLRPLAAQNRGIVPDVVMRIYGLDPCWITDDWRPALAAVGKAMVAVNASDPVWVTLGIALIRETLQLPSEAGWSAAHVPPAGVSNSQQLAARSSLGTAIGQRHRLTGSPADAEEALAIALACLEQDNPGVVDPGLLDYHASIAYRDHYRVTGEPDDCASWFSHAETAVRSVARRSPDRRAYVANLREAKRARLTSGSAETGHSDAPTSGPTARARPAPAAARRERKQVQAAARQIDRWVELRPPPLHHLREVSLPSDPTAVPEQLVHLLDRSLPIWRTTIEVFRFWTRDDALLIDKILLEPSRQELLSATDAALEREFGDISADPLDAELTLTRPYGRTQELLWIEHCRQLDMVPLEAWIAILALADACRGMADGVASDEEGLDASIRLQLVRGAANRVLGRWPESEADFSLLIAWYAHAKSHGLEQVVNARRKDWLDALYALLDSVDANDSIWSLTATVLVKDLSIGRFRVLPPLTFAGSLSKRVLVEQHAPFESPEWQQALAQLGTDSAFVDLVITEATLQVRVHRPDTSWVRIVDLASLEGVEARWFSVDGSVLEPSLETGVVRVAEAIASHRTEPPEQESSSRFAWITHYQTMTYAAAPGGRDWSWANRWNTMIPNPTKDIWKAVERIALRDAIAYCESTNIKHLVISPDGSLGAVPFHLIPRGDMRRLGDTHSVSYMPNLAGMLTLLDHDRLDRSDLSAVIVQDPSGTVGHAKWECDRTSVHVGPSATAVDPSGVTVAALQGARRRIDLFHFTGHAEFDWRDPEAAFLDLGHGQRMRLDELREMPFGPGSLAFLSACHTARRGTKQDRSTSHGLVSTLLEAGAATVICTMWPVESAAAALVANWFYEAWLGQDRLGRLESLELAVERLRSARKADCEKLLGSRIYIRGAHPFEDEYYWGAFVLYGAW